MVSLLIFAVLIHAAAITMSNHDIIARMTKEVPRNY